jgi:hypothetical protein
MAALQSGHRPRPARSSRAQARQKVWPQGMKAAPLPRATHTQQRSPTLPPSSSSPVSTSFFHCPPAQDVHCCSVRSSRAISDTLSTCALVAPPVLTAAGTGPAGARSSSAPRMTSRSVRRLLAAATRPPSSSSRSLRRSRRLDDAASCSASVTPRRDPGPGTSITSRRQPLACLLGLYQSDSCSVLPSQFILYCRERERCLFTRRADSFLFWKSLALVRDGSTGRPAFSTARRRPVAAAAD